MRTIFRRILTRHYFDLGGRIGRREFWLFVWGALLVTAATWAVAYALSQIAHRLTPAMNCAFSLVTLALLPPLAGVGARRLRDVGQNSLLVWSLIVPLAVTQVCQLLARQPFYWPNFVYFYGTYFDYLTWLIIIAVVALTSFWMKPDADEPAGARGARP